MSSVESYHVLELGQVEVEVHRVTKNGLQVSIRGYPDDRHSFRLPHGITRHGSQEPNAIIELGVGDMLTLNLPIQMEMWK